MGENGVLSVSADNITLDGAQVLNEGKGLTLLDAQNGLNLTALSVGYDEKLGQSNSYRNANLQDVVTSSVKGRGDVQLQAKNIHTDGGELEAAQRLTLIAENDAVLGAADKTATLEQYAKTKSRGFLSSHSSERYTYDKLSAHEATRLQGKNIELSAKHEIRLQGTQAKATENLVATAGGEINVDTLMNRHASVNWEKHKKSGLSRAFSGGVARVSYESSKLDTDTQQTAQIHQVARLTGEKGNIHLNSGKRLTLNATALNAQDILLDGSEVNLNAVIDKHDLEQHNKQRSFGVGVRMTIDAHNLKKQEYRQESANHSSHTLVGKWMNLSEAVDKAHHQMINYVAGYGHGQESQSHHYQYSETAQVNEIDAKGNLHIQARDKSITAQGGKLNAGQNVTLISKENVILDTAETIQSTLNQARRRGINVDGSQRWDGMLGVYHDKSEGESVQLSQQGVLITAGANSLVKAQTGNITMKGATVISEETNRLQAGQDIRLVTSTNYQGVGDENTKRGVGTARISDTERFYGYHRELGSHQQDTETHTGSTLVSLNGNISATAAGSYHQTSGEILAKDNIWLSAARIKADNILNRQEMHSHESDLKIGNFTRIKSPIIDLINTIESTVKNKEASDRVKAASLMSIAAQGYNLNELTFDPSKWKMDKNPMDGGYLFRVESGVGFSHKRDKREGWEKSSVANRFNAKAIELSARQGDINLTHTDLTSRDAHGHRIEGSQISLNARDGINYHGGENLRYYKGRQQSSGVEVGTAFSVGAKMGWSFYVQAGFNQGKQDREGQIVQNSLVDTEHLIINSGNLIAQNQQMAPTHSSDVNLSAVTAKAKSITTNIDGRLNIESRQSHEKERESSHGGGIHLEGGYGSSWNASVNVNAAKGKSERHQVLEQAGLFAEEGGYHITADRVHLKGSAIASTNPTNSRLQTNTLTFEDIQNYSSSQAISAGISAGYGQKEGEAHPNMSPGVPMSEREHDHTTTKATLTEGTILLNKDTTPVLSTALELGINTDLSQANNQTDKPKDINKALSEQQQIATAVGHVKSAVENYIKNQRKAAETEVAALEKQRAEAKSKGNQAQIDKLEAQLNTAKQRRNDWGTSGTNKRITDTVTNVLTTAIAGAPTEAIATTAISPWINQEIKRLTTNKTTGEVDKTTNAIAHAVWGAIEAASAKGNATAGAVAGASSELAAPLIAKALYGTDDPKQLTEVQKQNIVNLSSLVGAMGAGIANGNGSGTEVLTSANQGAEIGKRAVENNYLYNGEVNSLVKELAKAEKEGKDTRPIFEKYAKLSEKNRQEILKICGNNPVCYIPHIQMMQSGDEAAYENFSYLRLGTYFNNLSRETQVKLSDFVESENGKTRNLLPKSVHYATLALGASEAIGLGGLALKTKLPKGANANEKLPVVGETKGYNTTKVNLNNLEIEISKQNKHLENTNEYKVSLANGQQKSLITVSLDSLKGYVGTGQQVGKTEIGLPGSKERVNFNKNIGIYIDPVTGNQTPTTIGIIHYSKNGYHIVPAKPKE